MRPRIRVGLIGRFQIFWQILTGAVFDGSAIHLPQQMDSDRGLGLVAGTGLAIYAAYIAIANNIGWQINSIRLSPLAATIFFGFTALGCGGWAIYSAVGAISRLTCRQQLVLDDEFFKFPRSKFSSEQTAVSYSDIQKVKPIQIQKERQLFVVFTRGTFTISSNLLPNKGDFDEIQTLLTRAVAARQAGNLGASGSGSGA